jgi:hypothetical protein
MKKIILLLMAVLVLSVDTIQACGDDSSCCRKCCNFWSKGYGGPIMRVSNIEGQTAILLGGYGAWSITRHFALGWGGGGSVTPTRIQSESLGPDKADFDMGYGGLVAEFHFRTQKLVNLHTNVLLGTGGYQAGDKGGGFLVAEPSANISFKVVDFMRIGGGITYRYTHITSTDYLTSSQLSGLSGGIHVLFGYFGKPAFSKK